MKIKRFVCSDMTHAIRQIRDELGPDAVILSNQLVEGGVEISAAIDYDEAWVSQTQPARRASAKQSPARDVKSPAMAESTRDDDLLQRRREMLRALSNPNSEPPVSAVRDNCAPTGHAYAEPGEDSMTGMARELGVLRSMLERQLSSAGWSDLSRRDPVRAEVFQRLLDLGLTREFALDLCGSLPVKNTSPQQAWRNTLAVLAHRIVAYDGDILDEGGCFALLGPTGVGKTTTVAKLAARFALRHGVDSVALITTDSFRIGAHEQLSAFAQIMGIPVRIAPERNELANALDHYKNKRLVLIDTAGVSQRDESFVNQGEMLRAVSPMMRLILVMSCTSQHRILEESAGRFKDVGLDGAMITKMDEANSLGPVISTLCKHKIPVTYATNGQRVPEDIISARAHLLATRAVTLAQGNRSLPQGIYQEA